MPENKAPQEVQNKTAEQPTVEKPVAPASKPAPAKKQKIKLVLVGAGSYNDLNLKLGEFKKDVEYELDADMADKLLKTSLFKKV